MEKFIEFDQDLWHILLNVTTGLAGWSLGKAMNLDTGQKMILGVGGILTGNVLYSSPKVKEYGKVLDQGLSFSPDLIQVALNIVLAASGVFLGVQLGGSFEEKMLVGAALGGTGLLASNVLFNRYLSYLHDIETNLNLPDLTDLKGFTSDPGKWISDHPIKAAQVAEIPYDLMFPPLGVLRLMGFDPVEKIGHAIDKDAK